MDTRITDLPNDIDSLKKMINNIIHDRDHFKAKYQEEKRKNIFLEEQLNLTKHKIYGRSSEKSKDSPDQLGLFNEAEVDVDKKEEDQTEEEKIVVKEYKRVKRGRKPITKDLPRKEIIHDLTEEEKKCDCCFKDLPLIGQEVTEEVEVIPAEIFVKKHIKLKYGPCDCEESQLLEKSEIRTAKMPARMLAGSIAAEGLLAFILAGKYVDGLPFYRQEKILSRHGIFIPRMTMCNWAIKVAEKCEKLRSVILKEIRGAPFIQMDETRVQVIKEPGRSPELKSYMWVMMGYNSENKPLVLFNYHKSRSGQVAGELLRGFTGYLQTDGYPGYDKVYQDNKESGVENFTHVGCFVHSRRKFDEALKASKNKGSAQVALSFIKKIYKIEKELRKQLDENEINREEFTAERKEKVDPVLTDFKKWLDKKQQEILPESLIGKAVDYTLNQWEKMTRYPGEWFITPDNNRCENVIRPFVVGRKNWLFSYSPKGAYASALLYSLVESSKVNNLEPYHYLRYLFTYLPLAESEDDLKKLLPVNLTVHDLTRLDTG